MFNKALGNCTLISMFCAGILTLLEIKPPIEVDFLAFYLLLAFCYLYEDSKTKN
jgi:hypothetical protein